MNPFDSSLVDESTTKANGGLRPLTIASPRDKIVQQAIKMILEAIFEPIFLITWF